MLKTPDDIGVSSVYIDLLASCRRRKVFCLTSIAIVSYSTLFCKKNLQERGGRNMGKSNIGYIFRAWITDKNGNRIYAKDYGKRAFRIPVGSSVVESI